MDFFLEFLVCLLDKFFLPLLGYIATFEYFWSWNAGWSEVAITMSACFEAE